METITLEKYGHIISDSSLGGSILNDISSALSKGKAVTVDFQNVISMATFCSKQIFGSLYIRLTPQVFFDKIRMVNASSDMKIIVRLGIEKALSDQEVLVS